MYKMEVFYPVSLDILEVGHWVDSSTMLEGATDKEVILKRAAEIANHPGRLFTKVRVIEVVSEFKCPHFVGML